MKAPDECTTIEQVRQEIDRLDRAIIEALGQRFGYVKAVTRFKKDIADVQAPARYAHVLATRRVWAEDAGLSPDIIEKIYRDLLAYFIDEEIKQLSTNSSHETS